MSGNELVWSKPVENPNKLRNVLDLMKPQIALALPKHLTPERMVRVAMTAIMRTPKLMECSALSIAGSVIQAAELGLELSSPLGLCYLVPFWNSKTRCLEAQFQIGYRGLVALAFRSNQVSYFNAHEVRDGDYFEFEYGSDQYLKHRPAKERGDVTFLYSVFRTKDGASDFEVMTAKEVEEHRKQYSKQTSEYSPWITARTEMEKKTPLRRLAKRCPLSIELQTAAVLDEYAEHAMANGAANLLLPSPAIDAARDAIEANGNGSANGPVTAADLIGSAEVVEAANKPAPEAAAKAEPAKPAPSDAPDLDYEDFVYDIRQRLGAAASDQEFQAIGADLLKRRDSLGEDRYTKQIGRYQEAYKAFQAKAKSNDKGKGNKVTADSI